MEIDKQKIIVHRRRWFRWMFLALTLMYAVSLMATGLAILAYEQYLGNSSPVQGWLDRNATSYSTDFYDALYAMQGVSIAYREAKLDKQSQQAQLNLRERTELFAGILEGFDPATVVGEYINIYPSAREAMQSAKLFHDLVERWSNNAQSIPNAVIYEAEEKALVAMRRLTSESAHQEFQARDEMMLALNSSRMLADRALYIAIALFVFGLLALSSAYWASQALIKSERARFERLEYLLATVGHDLRSPLQAIVSCAQLLHKSCSFGDNISHLNIIKNSSEQLARLIDDLVSLARNEELSFHPHPLELQHWVERITARFTVDAERKGLKLLVSVTPNELPSVMFDETRLTQCVGNLLSNAINYTSSGTIKLTVNHINESADNGELSINVKDTGSGIAEKDRARIFMPFERASTGVHGKGLGLAIVSSIVRTARGKISLDTKLGMGSIFSISLPVTYAIVTYGVSVPTIKTDTKPNDNDRLLIVDNDPVAIT